MWPGHIIMRFAKTVSSESGWMLMGYSTSVQQTNWCAAKQCRNNWMKPQMQAILRNNFSVIKPFVLRP